MKVLLLYEYPASPSGLATQGDLLYRGLAEMGVDVRAVNLQSSVEKRWYYDWFKPDVVVGIGYWGYTPDIILHPQSFGALAVPWLVADGYIANYQEVLNSLPLILVTSNWVKEVYLRDGIRDDRIEVLPVGCDTDAFVPRTKQDPRVSNIRRELGVDPEEILILTVGGDLASKGGQEVLQALAMIDKEVPAWRYVGKCWPQARTIAQNEQDMQLAKKLGIADKFSLVTDIVSRNYMPYLLAASDIYAAPSRLEGYGMLQVEAGACEKPVVSIHAMGMLDTLVDGETAYLAKVGVENRIGESILGPEAGYEEKHKVIFDPPRIVDYRADVESLAASLLKLMNDPELRKKMGAAGRKRVVECFDYRLVARQFVQIIGKRLGLT
ncbi:MAG: glycosyltransferase family 4 protein [Chloroflexi bacterium]|nr:glycosyltransferase family 4 protein [Chloroflexota bacterium]